MGEGEREKETSSARGENCKEERIEMRGEEGKRNGNMEEHVMRNVKGERGEEMVETAEGENMEEYLRREGDNEERGEVKGEGDKESKEETRGENKVERREAAAEEVAPVWDTVLVQHGDLQGTQV